MATETLNPTARTCPASGQGGFACNSNTNTTASCTVASPCNVAPLIKDSCEWHSFDSPSFQDDWSSVHLEVPWTVDAQGTDEDDCSLEEVKLQYSTNGGSAWANFSGFPKTPSGSSQSGTASQSLSVGQNIADVRVRIIVQVIGLETCGSPPDPCGTTAGVSDVRIVATYPTGACCVGESCSVDAESACGGAYQGDGTDCSPNPCEGGGATGACCQGCVGTATSCAHDCDVTTEAACTGTYMGDGTVCSPNPCPECGACCNGETCTCKTQADCTGTWQGAGVDCSPNPCNDPTGACCLGAVCNVQTEATCTAAGGAYQGDSTTCSPDPCPANEPPVIVM